MTETSELGTCEKFIITGIWPEVSSELMTRRLEEAVPKRRAFGTSGILDSVISPGTADSEWARDKQKQGFIRGRFLQEYFRNGHPDAR